MGMRWEDTEWDMAASDGKEIYWWVYPDRRQPIRFVKRYTHTLAKLVAKRTGCRIEPVFEIKGE